MRTSFMMPIENCSKMTKNPFQQVLRCPTLLKWWINLDRHSSRFFSWTTRQLERMQWQHTLSLLALWFLAHLFSLELAVSWNAKDFGVKPDLKIEFPWSLSYLWVFVVLALFEVMVSEPLFGISGINLSASSPHRWNQWKLARSSGPSAAASRTFTWWVFIGFFFYVRVMAFHFY